MKRNNLPVIKNLQIASAMVYFISIVIYSILFSNGTKKTDYEFIRVYGTSLFGILGLLSFLILGILEIYWIVSTVGARKTENFNEQNLKSTPSRQTGMNLIIVYQITFGLMMIFGSMFIYALLNIRISFGRLGGSAPNQNSGLGVVVFLIIIWGLVGILSGILLSRWNYYGYFLSWFFILSTGIILFWIYLTPLICTILSLYYFLKNKEFKEKIHQIKVQRSAIKSTK